MHLTQHKMKVSYFNLTRVKSKVLAMLKHGTSNDSMVQVHTFYVAVFSLSEDDCEFLNFVSFFI